MSGKQRVIDLDLVYLICPVLELPLACLIITLKNVSTCIMPEVLLCKSIASTYFNRMGQKQAKFTFKLGPELAVIMSHPGLKHAEVEFNRIEIRWV